MLAVVAAVAFLESTDLAGTQIPVSKPVSTRLLTFRDEAHGAVGVYDTETGRLVTRVTGEAGFLRVTIRGLAQERNMRSMSPDVPFRLTQWADGRLTLDDPLTSRHIEFAAFGPTNEAVFAELLTSPEPQR